MAEIVGSYGIEPSPVAGWFFVLRDGCAVAEVDSYARAWSVIMWWETGCSA